MICSRVLNGRDNTCCAVTVRRRFVDGLNKTYLVYDARWNPTIYEKRCGTKIVEPVVLDDQHVEDQTEGDGWYEK